MSNERFWDETPADGEQNGEPIVGGNDPVFDGDPAAGDSPLMANEIFPELGALTEVEVTDAGLAVMWPMWRVEPPVNHRGEPIETDPDDVEVVSRSSFDDGDEVDSAIASIQGTDAHPMGDLYIPAISRHIPDDDVLQEAHTIAATIERLKAAAPDTAINTYLEWIQGDDLPGSIERNIIKTRPRWHRILVGYFLPQYPKLWDAPDDLADPNDPGYEADPGFDFDHYPDDFVPPADMPQWMKEVRTAYGQESGRVIMAANALHANTPHAHKLAHDAVHDETAWRDHARDALAHAAMYLTSYSDDDWDAIEIPDSEIPARIDAALKPQIMAKSVLYLSRYFATDALNRVRDSLRSDIEQNPGRWVDLIKQARHNLELPPVEITLQAQAEPAKRTPPARHFQASLFGDNGYGWGPSNPIVIGARHMHLAPKTAWETDGEEWPIYRWGNGGAHAAYTPGRQDFGTVAAAWDAVKRYGIKHQMLFSYVMTLHLSAAADSPQRAYGMFEFSVDQYLEERGVKKHQNGGYKTEDRREVVELLHDLARTEVKGTAYARKGRKKEPVPVDVYSKLILLSSRIEGDDYRFAMRGGDFMYQIEAAGKQYLLTTRALLQLNQQRDAMAIQLGAYIQEMFRIRGKGDDLARPIRVADLLEGAEITINRKDPGPFLERIEKGLNTIADPKQMDNAPILKGWKYKTKPKTYGRGWLNGWLDTGVILTPEQPYQEQQSKIRQIGARSRTRQQKKGA